MLTEEDVLDALSCVTDPELDEPITDLGFVVSVAVEGSMATVGLRLPTFFCAPNFAYMMVADAHDAIVTLPGVSAARVVLLDHFADQEISGGLAGAQDFAATFAGDTDGGDLDELRATFARKAYLARTHLVVDRMLARGWQVDQLGSARLADLPDCDESRRFLDRRAELGHPIDPDALLLLDVWGEPVLGDAIADHLRRARTVHISIEGNAGFCRGLLATRYAENGTGDPAARQAVSLAGGMHRSNRSPFTSQGVNA